MSRSERVREAMSSPPTPEYLRERASQGWRLVAVEWERPVEEADGDAGVLRQEIPYGLQVARDCRHLCENPVEKEAMTLILELIVADQPLSRVAQELTRQGYRTRQGTEWTQTGVFYLLPRLIEVAPQIFASADWKDRRVDVTERLSSLMQ